MTPLNSFDDAMLIGNKSELASSEMNDSLAPFHPGKYVSELNPLDNPDLTNCYIPTAEDSEKILWTKLR